MIVQPIVEGEGDVQAVPVLLRRLADAASVWNFQVKRPHRRRRTQLVQKDELQRAVRVALLDPCDGVIVLFDADDDCPKQKGPVVGGWAQEAAGATPCPVVLANREYEAWIVAGIEAMRAEAGVRADATPPVDPEQLRDAKGQLEMRLCDGVSYLPTADQASFTAQFDLASTYRSCRSFRKLVSSFGRLLAATGNEPPEWPPAGWSV